MKFHLVSIFPELFRPFLEMGVIAGAYKNNLFDCEFYNPRDYVDSSYKSVDDEPYGGGDGMVMSYDPLKKIIEKIHSQNEKSDFEVVLLSPKGKLWTAALAEEYANKQKNLVLISGRYAGIDQRFIHKYVDKEISIGDYIVSGGELPAMILMDSILRHKPQVLGNHLSAKLDSFQDMRLEVPCFTRPAEVDGMQTPEILKSGHHAKIAKWRDCLSLVLTAQIRPDLIDQIRPSLVQIQECKIWWENTSEKERKLLGLGDRFPFEAS